MRGQHNVKVNTEDCAECQSMWKTWTIKVPAPTLEHFHEGKDSDHKRTQE